VVEVAVALVDEAVPKPEIGRQAREFDARLLAFDYAKAALAA